MKVHHLPNSTSYHSALLVFASIIQRQTRAKRFHFEAMWTKNVEYKSIIENSWSMDLDLSTPEGVMANLSRYAVELSKWSSNVFGQIPKKIQAKRNELNSLALQDKDEALSTEINCLRREINNLLDDEEIYWGQRAKAHQLKEDENTNFFHVQASEWRKQNTITGIWDGQGRWCNEKDSIVQVAVDYFENIYKPASPTLVHEVTAAIPTRVTEEVYESLNKNFTREEVTTALKEIHPTKAPSLDGMSAIFYQKYWNIVGCSITNMVLNVLNGNMFVASLNRTNIALIPKINNPKKMVDFWPISLCNVVYKLISKTIANRIEALLPHVILENQSAFTFDRLIIDNVLVAFKLMHFLNHKNAGKEGYMTAKLDMSKTFDRVEWCFIQAVMEKLGFSSKQLNLVIRCITSVSYFVLINVAACGNITPT